MFTLKDSIRNLYHYILDNYKYLLNNRWKCRDYTSMTHTTDKRFYYDGHLVVEMGQTYIIITLNFVVCDFIKAFNIPDFHVQIGSFGGRVVCDYGYQSLEKLYNMIRHAPSEDSLFLYLDDGLSDSEDEHSFINTQFMVDVINCNTIIGIILDVDSTYLKDYLFERMSNLKYIWIGDIEYTRNNGIMTSCEFDHELRIASMYYENELLDDCDYKKRYCIYNKSYSKR